MDQKSISKMKLFRTLKVVYYCLGMPLFILACMTLASQMYGHWPFAGDPGTGSIGFEAFKVFFGSPAMYSVWIAFGIWLIIGIVQIICHKTVKNRRARTMIVVAVMLVVLIVPIFVIDAVFGAKVEQISADAPDGVVVEDYNYQLSYFHTKSGAGLENGKRLSLTDTLIKNVGDFCRVYNVPFYGGAKISKSNNFTNEGLYYDYFGFDYNENGTAGDAGDHILITNTFDTKSMKADADGRYWFDSITLNSKSGANTLEVNGNFYCVVFGQAIPVSYESSETKNVSCFVWYNGDKGSFVQTEGTYGTAYYNKNGLLSDGYIYDIDVALNILEQYYVSQQEMTAAYKVYSAKKGVDALSEDELKASITADAATRLYNRYNGAEATDEDKALWERENAMASSYSLTAGELDIVLSELGDKVGSASLLENVMPLAGGLIGGLLNIESILTDLLGNALGSFLYEKLNLTGVTIGISYPDGENLKLSLTGGAFSGENEVVIDFNDTLSAASLEEDLIQVFKNVGIIPAEATEAEGKEALVGVLASVLNLLGLSVSGEAADVSELLVGVLQSLYWYQSPIIDNVYEYYVDDSLTDNEADTALKQYQAAYAKFMRAQYEGGAHGYMIGSRLIGGSLGDGSFTEAQGLASLTEVKQLQIDMSYQPTMYSIFILREMLMTFAAIIIFFTLLAYIAADREILYATGQIVPKAKKENKAKKGEAAPEENTEPLSLENSEKEVE